VFVFIAGALAAYAINNLTPRRIGASLPMLSVQEEQKLTGSSKAVKLLNPQGVETFARVWEAPGGGSSKSNKKGTVLLVHGFSWHSLYFSPLARALQAAGFRVVAYDLQGHGRSGTIDGAKGYATRFDDWVKELGMVARELCLSSSSSSSSSTAKDEDKLFIFAESMGATIVLRALTGAAKAFGHVEKVKSVVFSGPVIRVAKEVLPPPPVVVVIKLLATFFPLFSVPSSEVKDGFEGAFGDTVFAKQAKLDPLVIFDNPRLRSASEILSTVDKNGRSFAQVTQPILVLHGQDDKRTHAANSKDLIEGVSSIDKKLVVLPGV